MQATKVDPATHLTSWQAILAFFGSSGFTVLWHTIFGKNKSKHTKEYVAFLQESKQLKEEMRDFRTEVSKMREAFAALTGKTINGIEYRGD
jgi:hypothetical protein